MGKSKGDAAVLENAGDGRVADAEGTPIFRNLPLREVFWQGTLKGWRPIQTLAIGCIQEDEQDVVVRALPKEGKTLAYLVCVAKPFSFRNSTLDFPYAIIILPTIELCTKVHKELTELAEIFKVNLKASLMTSASQLLTESPNIVVSTPSVVLSAFELGFLQTESLQFYLRYLVLDEVDLLFLPGFEDGLKSVKSIIHRIPKSCQCLVFSANPSADVKKLESLVVRNPYVLTLTEDGHCEAEIFPYNFRHFYVPCKEEEKCVYLQSFLELCWIGDRFMIFTNSDDRSFMVKSFLQEAGHKPAMLLAEPTEESIREVQDFNAGNSCLLIATDHNLSAAKQAMGMKKKSRKLLEQNWNSECDVFENVDVVVHFDMPRDAVKYVGRIVSTHRQATKIGYSICLATSLDKNIFRTIKSSLREGGNLNTDILVPASWLGFVGDVDDDCPRFSADDTLYGQWQ